MEHAVISEGTGLGKLETERSPGKPLIARKERCTVAEIKRPFCTVLSQEHAPFEQAIETCLDICNTFALLELRIQGKLPAWEGILLVKERREG